MKTLRRTLAYIVVMLLLVVAFHSVSAAAVNRVYGAGVTFYIQDGKSMISTPIKIENNSGFMGFAITVSYKPDAFKPVKVQRGDLISGMFEDSIGYSEDGSFRVVFSGSSECTADGELFTLIFEEISTFTEERIETIGLSYSKQDTFNEQWNDVTLNCEDIQVSFGQPSTEPAREPETEPTSEPEESTTIPVIDPQPEKKLSERLEQWYASRPVAIQVLLWIFVKPLIRLIAATE